MKWAIVLLCAAIAAAQVKTEAQLISELSSTLTALKNLPEAQAIARLAAHLDQIPEGRHQPKRGSTKIAADQIRSALGARTVPQPAATRIAKDAVFLLRSAGLGTWLVEDAAARIEKELLALGLPERDAKRAAQAFRILADQVRGPQDLMAGPGE